MEPYHRRCGRGWLDEAPLTGLGGDNGVDDDRVQFVPMWAIKSRAQHQAVCAAAGPSLAPATDGERGNQPPGKLIDENQVATRTQNPCAFGEPGELIRPMIE
jgi:hypothetical protein